MRFKTYGRGLLLAALVLLLLHPLRASHLLGCVARSGVVCGQESQPVQATVASGTPQEQVQPTAESGMHQGVDPRFGVIEAFWQPEEAAALPVGWDRILFYWNEIQPTGPDDWNTLHVLEEWLVEAEAQDRMVMGLLKNTPAWATDGAPFSGVPRGLYLPVDDPDNLWAGYVRKVVEYLSLIHI